MLIKQQGRVNHNKCKLPPFRVEISQDDDDGDQLILITQRLSGMF
jgi:hypothetical protein